MNHYLIAPEACNRAAAWEKGQVERQVQTLRPYLVQIRNDKNQIKTILFPLYHQLDATRKLVQAVQEEGAGQKYLIQHSAGSGKTNSIAWAAHSFMSKQALESEAKRNGMLKIYMESSNLYEKLRDKGLERDAS